MIATAVAQIHVNAVLVFVDVDRIFRKKAVIILPDSLTLLMILLFNTMFLPFFTFFTFFILFNDSFCLGNYHLLGADTGKYKYCRFI